MTDPHALRLAAQRLLTCVPVIPCAKEEDCFQVSRALLRLLPEPLPDEPDDDTIPNYAPNWRRP